MTTIIEGALTFTFPAEWAAVKYDETRFYREDIVSLGAELKAVDIIALPPDRAQSAPLLIEVKDFRGHAVENRKRQINGELIKEVIGKATHTLAALYLSRRVEEPVLRQFSSAVLNPEAALNLVLFMQEDTPATRLELEAQKSRIANLEIKYRGRLKKNRIGFRIASLESLRMRDGWSAT